jgi:hypothetical protein
VSRIFLKPVHGSLRVTDYRNQVCENGMAATNHFHRGIVTGSDPKSHDRTTMQV